MPDFSTYGSGYILDNYQVAASPVDAQIFGSATTNGAGLMTYAGSGASGGSASSGLYAYVDTSTPLEEVGDAYVVGAATASLTGAVQYASTMLSSDSDASSAILYASLGTPTANTISVPWVPTGATLPTNFVLPFREPVFNQGQAANAPLFAITAFKSQMEFEEHRTYYDFNESTYYQSVKAVDGIPEEGSTMEASVGVLTSYGYLADAEIFKLDDPFVFPVGTSYKMADVDEIKDALYTGRVVVLGIQMDDGFRDSFADVLPEPTGTATDAHAFVVYGWDDDKETDVGTGALYIKNSWGTSWGANGFAWMPYTYLSTYLFDAWCVDDVDDVIP